MHVACRSFLGHLSFSCSPNVFLVLPVVIRCQSHDYSHLMFTIDEEEEEKLNTCLARKKSLQ